MHYFILPTSDSWISSGSSTITGESFKDQNFGRDQILELKKFFYNDSFHHQTRALINFAGTDFDNLKQKIIDGDISSDAKFYLKLYEAEGNSKLSETYNLTAYPLNQSWEEGTGKFGDNPKNTNGVSWENTTNPINGTNISWSLSFDGISFDDYHSLFNYAEQTFSDVSSSSEYITGGNSNGGVYVTDNGFEASQSFNLESPDVEMDVTDMVNQWIDGFPNYGMILKFSGSQETDSSTFGKLKFFSRNTHTIYSPRLEVRWNDSDSTIPINMNEITTSGLIENHLYIRGLKENYKENEKVKFRIGARKKYIQKTFTNSIQNVTGSYVPTNSGSYAIKDVATDEFIVPFSDYTKISIDTAGSYFNQWLDGFHPDRVYKILLKLQYDDGQEQIFDDDFEFIIKRG
tara:strand:+ start:13895 stop:15103 length:1209 start_codon:yes stop_codon:yes gene_type:complete